MRNLIAAVLLIGVIGSANAFVVESTINTRQIEVGYCYDNYLCDSEFYLFRENLVDASWSEHIGAIPADGRGQISAGIDSSIPLSGDFDTYTFSVDLYAYESSASYSENFASANIAVTLIFSESVQYSTTCSEDMVFGPIACVGGYGTGVDQIYALDLATGERSVFSDGSVPGSGHQFSLPGAAAIDIDNDRLLVIDEIQNSIVAVDLETGFRSVFAGDGIPNSGTDLFFRAEDILVDAPGNRALVADIGALIAIDLDSGARTVISDSSVPDAANMFDFATGVALDRRNNRALVLDADRQSIIAVELSTGERVIVSQ
jgi:hypothetical protein